MPELLNHLEIGSSCGGCFTELVSTCRVLNHLSEIRCCSDDAGCSGYWKIQTDCPDCCCDFLDPQASIFDAPWYDPNIPASADFLGLHGSLELASPPSQTSVSADGASTAAIPKQITFIGAIISKSKAGTVFGEQWIEKQLLPDCPACEGRPIRFYLHCQDITANPEIPQLTQEVPDPYVGWEQPCGGCGCDDVTDAETLGPAQVPIQNDNGARDLLRVRYNPGSFSRVPTDGDVDIPYCAGKRVTFSFTVLESFQYLDPVEGCEINSETFPYDPLRCFTYQWSNPEPEQIVAGKPGCLPERFVITTEDRGAATVAPDDVLACRWSKPLSTFRVACLTPYFAGDAADMVINFNPGNESACNVAITMWESGIGWPHPANPAGRSTYPIATAVGRAEIPYATAGETIPLDGRTSLSTPGVTGCGGGIYRQPSIPCNRRFWVVLDLDCLNMPGDDWTFSVDLHPRERVVG